MEKYRLVQAAIREAGPDDEVEVHAPDDRVPDGVRPNLLARFTGRDASRTLWILSHVDVVPPGDPGLWDTDPFAPVLKRGFLYGRGVEDNGQALAASLFAVKAVKEGSAPAMNVGLAVVSDEETGSRYGLDYVLQQRLDLFSPDDLIVVPDAGNEDGTDIEVAEKHLLQVRFTARGKQGHASRPDLCRNTLRAIAHLIVALDTGLPQAFGTENRFFTPATSTFEPTRKDANVPNVNTIPGENIVYFDCRILPNESLDGVLEKMRHVAADVGARFEVEITAEPHMRFDAPDPTPADAPVVVALAQAVQEVVGVQARPMGIGGQTVAAFFRKRNLPAAVWSRLLNHAHAPNECISVENLALNTKVFARMMTG